MDIQIKVWPDHTASLMTTAGLYLFHFKNVENALTACREWYGINKQKVIPTIAAALPSTGMFGTNRK